LRPIVVVLSLFACESAAPPKQPMVLSDNWCDRVMPGAAGAGTAAEVSRAHAGIRFFGMQANYPAVDRALAAALKNSTQPDLDAYAASVGACALAASPAPMAQARVDLKGDVAIVHPGTGAVTLPAGTKAVAIDLRDAPDDDAALQAAIAPALGTPMPRSSLWVRRHSGMDDEVIDPTHPFYFSKLVALDRPSLMPGGTADLPLILLTGPRLAPAAAEWAGELRIQGRAVIVGASVMVSAAEAEWSPIGNRGLMWRKRELLIDKQRWPDEIAEDIRSDDPESRIAEARKLSVTFIDITQGGQFRPPLERFDLANQVQSTDLDIGVMRAALYAFHGATRLFYPYFPVVGDDIDARLDEVLASLESDPAVDRGRARKLIARFANALRDGHFFYFDMMQPQPAGYLPILVDWFGAQPVVHTSMEPLVHPGDTITSYAGMAIEDWYTAQAGTISAATDGAVKLRAGMLLQQLAGPTDLTLKDPSGATRNVTVQPQATAQMTPFIPTRQNGFLTDLGSPDIYYFNLDASVTMDPVTWNMQLADAHSATGIVLDMRGYPAQYPAMFDFMGDIIGKPWPRPEYIVPVYQGIDAVSVNDTPSATIGAPADPGLAYAGPVVWLVGPYTQSHAEDVSMSMIASGRIKKVIGRTSAGTDGDITGMWLPGNFGVSFTGMDVRFPDGSQFDAVGIVPDVVVSPSPADLAAGIDSDLAEGIKQIRN
jgi:Peptidase family S41